MSLLRLDGAARLAPWGPLALRLFLGTFLAFMTQDNVLSRERMLEFERFLGANGFPAAAFLAPLSVYAQLGCGVLVLLGLFTRWAALFMVVNFVVAIVGVHLKLPFRTFLEPTAMLAVSLALLFLGPGRLAIDNIYNRKRSAPQPGGQTRG
jgi:putative oxidoreductase